MNKSKIFVVLTAVSVVACTRMLDIDVVKKAISDGVNTQLGLTVASVSCPDKREIKANDKFDCTATPSVGGKLTVQVSQTDDKGNITWTVTKAEGLLDLAALETLIVNTLKEDGTEATASCGGKYRAAQAGSSFECTATTAEGEKAQVAVTVKDAAGNVSIELVQQDPQ